MSRIALLAAVSVATAALALPDALESFGQGALMVRPCAPHTSEAPRLFPLKHTDVDAEVSGFISRVTVRQSFVNPYAETIEAVYVFPLPDDAAVDAMVMRIGGRVVRGMVKKREEARANYERAKSRGQAAALLDQERPNIFTQSVTNIRPGDQVEIEIRYAAPLKYDDGAYEFHFPMTVGPRFVPGRALQGDSQGTGRAPDTDRVPDASRISPPVLSKGTRSAHDISLRVLLDAGVPIGDLRSPSHLIEVERPASDLAEVTLSPADTIPNKDFVLRWQVAGAQLAAGLLATRGARGGYFSLMLQPKAAIRDEEIASRELVFVFDTSGSQMGAPIEKQKEVVRQALGGMRAGDTFQILDFNERVTAFSRAPVPWNGSNAERALRYIDELRAGGGTFMLEAIQEVLRAPADPARVRIVVWLTDGYIGNDEEILAAIERDLGGARLFSFGVGSSVNRYLIERMAILGRGVAQVVRPDEPTEQAVSKFHERIARPQLTDVTLDWGDLPVQDVYPARLPDLFSAQPVLVHGRFAHAARGRLHVRGRRAGRPFEQVVEVELPEREERHQALASVWARARLEDLTMRMHKGERPELVREATELALAHQLVSKWTSFVAVEERVIHEGGVVRTVAVPVEVPQFVEHEGVFGDEEGIGGAASNAMGGVGTLGVGYGGGGKAVGMGVPGYGAGAPTGTPAVALPMAPPAAAERARESASADESEARGLLSRLLSAEGEAKAQRRSEAPARGRDAEEHRMGARPQLLAKPPGERRAPPRAALGEVNAAGAPASPALRAILERHLRALLPSLAGARGALTLRLAVGADGKVARVEVVRSTLAAADEKQVVDAARAWTFPAGDQILLVPLTLEDP